MVVAPSSKAEKTFLVWQVSMECTHKLLVTLTHACTRYTAGGDPVFPLELYNGVTQAHFFTQSHHGSSCADSYGGKAKQHLLKRSVNEGRTAWNYSSAYMNCRELKPKPHKNNTRLWACDGEYIWGALSNGRDTDRQTFDNIPKFKGKVTGVDGCMSMYAFRHVSGFLWSVRCGSRLKCSCFHHFFNRSPISTASRGPSK